MSHSPLGLSGQTKPLRSRDPARIADHPLLGRLGEGGQGTVYLAADSHGERVAIKVLHGQTRLGAVAGLQKEVAAARTVAPFCTARIIEVGEDDGIPYVVTEFIDGPSLREAVANEGPMTGTSLYRLAVGTATALAAIHQAGIVHRDFKPGNVLLGPDGPRVIDFGIARIVDATVSASSGVMGTPSYMAPEQLEGKGVGPEADVFGWGATIAFAALGRPPFGQDTIPAVMNRIMTGQPDLGGLTEPLRDLVSRCLAKDPRKRPKASQILLKLIGHAEGPINAPDALARGLAFTNAPDADLAGAETYRWTTVQVDPGVLFSSSTRRRRRILTGAGAVTLAAALTAGAIGLLQNQRTPPAVANSPAPAPISTASSVAVPAPAAALELGKASPTDIARGLKEAVFKAGTAAFTVSLTGFWQGDDVLESSGRLSFMEDSGTDYDLTTRARTGHKSLRVVLLGDVGYRWAFGETYPADDATYQNTHGDIQTAMRIRWLTSPHHLIELVQNTRSLKAKRTGQKFVYSGSMSSAMMLPMPWSGEFYDGFSLSRLSYSITADAKGLPERLSLQFHIPSYPEPAGIEVSYRLWGQGGRISGP